MAPILLRTDLHKTLTKEAEQSQKSVDDLVNEAVEHYLRQRQRDKLNEEVIAYEKMHTNLKKNYLGQWIAIHDKQIVDHDVSKIALYRRVRGKYGRISVLIRQVKELPIEEIWIRTPNTGRVMR